MRLFDVKSSHNVLNDYDIRLCERLLRKLQRHANYGIPATDFQEICRSKLYWVTLASPTINHGAKKNFGSWLSRIDEGYIYS